MNARPQFCKVNADEEVVSDTPALGGIVLLNYTVRLRGRRRERPITD